MSSGKSSERNIRYIIALPLASVTIQPTPYSSRPYSPYPTLLAIDTLLAYHRYLITSA